jgi:protein-L-isoaspartate(D-aspartate) O-methyltransferase
MGNLRCGWPEHAPFDGIIVTAAAPRIPTALPAQLAPGGRLVIPLGDLASQELVVVQRTAHGLVERRAGGVRFVPLISRHGFSDPTWR